MADEVLPTTSGIQIILLNKFPIRVRPLESCSSKLAGGTIPPSCTKFFPDKRHQRRLLNYSILLRMGWGTIAFMLLLAMEVVSLSKESYETDWERSNRVLKHGIVSLDDVLDTLLDQEGLEVDPIDRLEGDTPLHKAVRFVNELAKTEWEAGGSIVELLLDAGADPRYAVDAYLKNRPLVGCDLRTLGNFRPTCFCTS